MTKAQLIIKISELYDKRSDLIEDIKMIDSDIEDLQWELDQREDEDDEI